jgi:hypothetical protein
MTDPFTTFPEVLDSSMMAAFKSCPQLFFKVYIAQWKSRTEKVDLHAGKAFARGLEIARRGFFEQGLNAEAAEAKGLAALFEAYGNYECPSDNPKSAERVAGAYAFYMDSYPFTMNTGFPILLPGEKRAIEISFTNPLAIDHPETGHPILYTGRGDMICSYAGANYIEDDKTTKSLGSTWSQQWDLRGQFLGYTWGFRNSGFTVAGCLVRGVSILKTKYETQEAICNFSDFEIDRWYGELLEWIEDMKTAWRTKRWRYNLDRACTEYGGCGFKTVCKAQDEGPWLEQYFERRHWDPVTRIETKI